MSRASGAAPAEGFDTVCPTTPDQYTARPSPSALLLDPGALASREVHPEGEKECPKSGSSLSSSLNVSLMAMAGGGAGCPSATTAHLQSSSGPISPVSAGSFHQRPLMSTLPQERSRNPEPIFGSNLVDDPSGESHHHRHPVAGTLPHLPVPQGSELRWLAEEEDCTYSSRGPMTTTRGRGPSGRDTTLIEDDTSECPLPLPMSRKRSSRVHWSRGGSEGLWREPSFPEAMPCQEEAEVDAVDRSGSGSSSMHREKGGDGSRSNPFDYRTHQLPAIQSMPDMDDESDSCIFEEGALNLNVVPAANAADFLGAPSKSMPTYTSSPVRAPVRVRQGPEVSPFHVPETTLSVQPEAPIRRKHPKWDTDVDWSLIDGPSKPVSEEPARLDVGLDSGGGGRTRPALPKQEPQSLLALEPRILTMTNPLVPPSRLPLQDTTTSGSDSDHSSGADQPNYRSSDRVKPQRESMQEPRTGTSPQPEEGSAESFPSFGSLDRYRPNSPYGRECPEKPPTFWIGKLPKKSVPPLLLPGTSSLAAGGAGRGLNGASLPTQRLEDTSSPTIPLHPVSLPMVPPSPPTPIVVGCNLTTTDEQRELVGKGDDMSGRRRRNNEDDYQRYIPPSTHPTTAMRTLDRGEPNSYFQPSPSTATHPPSLYVNQIVDAKGPATNSGGRSWSVFPPSSQVLNANLPTHPTQHQDGKEGQLRTTSLLPGSSTAKLATVLPPPSSQPPAPSHSWDF